MPKMINPKLKNYEYLVDLLADFLGGTCEVVLHDVSDIKHSIVKIRNGHITNRQIGGPITDLGLKMIKENGPETILFTERTKSRKTLRSAGLVIRESKRIIGFLCINMDIHMSSHEGLNRVMAQERLVNTEEHYEMNTDDLIQNIILDALKRINKNIKDLNREDKLHILKNMEEKGIFQIRGAVKKAAEVFSLSNVSIYKHLSNIRKYNKL